MKNNTIRQATADLLTCSPTIQLLNLKALFLGLLQHSYPANINAVVICNEARYT